MAINTSKKRHAKRTTHKNKNNKHSKIENIVLELFTFLNSVKLYHWRTKYTNVHLNTDELVNEMSKNVDKFVENYLGMKQINSNNADFDFNNIHKTNLLVFNNVKQVEKYVISFKNYLIKHITEKDGSTSLVIRDDMLENINKFLYLLQLK